MLPKPSPRNRGTSRNDIRNPDRSLISKSRLKINAASVTLMDTIWIESNPNEVSLLTKIPMLPQKHAASMISIKFSFLFSDLFIFFSHEIVFRTLVEMLYQKMFL